MIPHVPLTDHKATNGNAKRVEPEVALAYLLALPEAHRTYATVARRFGVTPSRISQIASEHGWRERVAALEREERRELERSLRVQVRSLARDRAKRIIATVELYDRANELALQMLPVAEDGTIDVDAIPGGAPRLDQILERIPALFKVAELAVGEATDRVAIAEIQPVLVAFARIAVLNAPADRRQAVYRELEQASAGLPILEGQVAA